MATDYATAWMLRYCDLEQWKDAYQYAINLAKRPDVPTTEMLKDLRTLYWDVRDYLVDDNRREIVETLDVYFDKLYIELDMGIKMDGE